MWVTTDKDGMFSFWDLLHHNVVVSHHISGETPSKVKEESTLGVSKGPTEKSGAGRIATFSNLNINNKTLKNLPEKNRNRLNIVHYLLDITEIAYIKLLALASTDKHIRIWDLNDIHKPRIIFCLNLIKGGVHQLRFLNAYQVLLVAGYENSIPVFNITAKYYDVNVVGRLVGHVSIVTAIDVIEGTPMVITADDTGSIKTWDIRSFQCYQTIEMSHKTIIGQLLSMENINKVAFIGCRVNFIEFDKFDRPSKAENRELVPLRADINMAEHEMIICTNSDIKFLDIQTGKIKKIYAHMLDQDKPDEISSFRMLQKNHKFILGDPKGDMTLYSYTSGQRLNKIEGHGLQILDIKVDNYNKLLVSVGADGKILIQQEKLDSKDVKNNQIFEDVEEEYNDLNLMGPEEILKKINNEDRKMKEQDQLQHRVKLVNTETNTAGKQKKKKHYEVFRTILNVHNNSEITCMAVSVYHNMIASTAQDSTVCLFDYEFGKFITKLVMVDKSQVTAMEFINGLGILMVCANNGFCYFIQIANKADGKTEPEVIYYIDINSKIEISKTRVDLKSQASSTKTLVVNSSLREIGYPSSNDKAYEVKSLILDRPVETHFVERIHVSLSLVGDNKVLEEFKKNQVNELDNIGLNYCEVFFALDNGFISIFDLTLTFKGHKILKHSNTRLNYNPFRANIEDCAGLIYNPRTFLNLSPASVEDKLNLIRSRKRSFFAHRGSITSISVIKVPHEYLLTTGCDKYVKVINMSGDCITAWNVNHPLPLKWDLQVDLLQDIRTKVLFGLKVIQSIFKRYYNMLYVEGKIFDLKSFIKQYHDLEAVQLAAQSERADGKNLNIFGLTQIKEENEKPNARVMADEYMAKDFVKGKLKELYRQELVGPSLKQIETKRRLLLVQQEWRQEELQSKTHLNSLNKKKDVKVRRYSDDERIEIRDLDFQGNPKRNTKIRSEVSKKLEGTLDMIDRVVEKIEISKSKVEKNKAEKEFKTLRPVELHKTSTKGFAGEQSSQLSKLHQSYISKFGRSSSKPDFYEHAQARRLVNLSIPVKKTEIDEPSTDSIKKKLQEQLDNCIDFTEQGKIKRMQRAIKDYNKEKSDFSKVINGINNKLKKSQFKNIGSRTSSLPLIKQNDTPYGLVPFPPKKPSKARPTQESTKHKQSNFSNLN